MTKKNKIFLVATGVAVFLFFMAFIVVAGDAPHDASFSVGCDSCHMGHSSLGENLTNQTTNALLCQQCHDSASDHPMLESFNNTTPGVTGMHHRWAVSSVNTAVGAVTPANVAMNTRLDGTNIICSTCHNQHWTNKIGDVQPESPYPVQANQTSDAGLAGPADGVMFEPASATPEPRGYLVDFTAGGGYSTASYRVSYNQGTTWWGYTGGVWVENDLTARVIPANSSTAQNLDNDSIANAYFDVTSNNFDIGDQYTFYISYPFGRIALDSGDNTTGDKFCRDCHSDWVMTHTDTATYDGTYKSHPVGVALNTNGKSYDRGVPLDANGAPQGGAGVDSNHTNDLKLDSGNLVQCMSCHAVHYADSNSLTEDRP